MNTNNKYKIIRMFFEGGQRTIKSGLTLEQAQNWCNDPETSSSTCTTKRKLNYTAVNGAWFDGYENY